MNYIKQMSPASKGVILISIFAIIFPLAWVGTLIFGIVGVKQSRDNPVLKGMLVSWIAIVFGGLMSLLLMYWLLVLLGFVEFSLGS